MISFTSAKLSLATQPCPRVQVEFQRIMAAPYGDSVESKVTNMGQGLILTRAYSTSWTRSIASMYSSTMPRTTSRVRRTDVAIPIT